VVRIVWTKRKGNSVMKWWCSKTGNGTNNRGKTKRLAGELLAGLLEAIQWTKWPGYIYLIVLNFPIKRITASRKTLEINPKQSTAKQVLLEMTVGGQASNKTNVFQQQPPMRSQVNHRWCRHPGKNEKNVRIVLRNILEESVFCTFCGKSFDQE